MSRRKYGNKAGSFTRYRNNRRKNKKFPWKAMGTGIQSVAKVASTALSIAQGVASLINVEFKRRDSATSVNITSAGNVHHMTAIAQGDGASNRDGESVKVKGISFKSYVNHNPSGLTEQLCRIIIFRDIDSRGAIPAVTDLLDTANVISHRNLDNTSRFTVLMDRIISVNADNDTTNCFKYIDKDMHVKWTDTASTDTASGHLYLLYVTNEPSINYPLLTWNYRIRYVDN